MTPRYPLAEPLIGTGDLDVSGPVGGQQVRDFRQRGFWARITAQPDATKNAYGFIRCDDFDPATFASLTGAIEQGDGTTLAAYEVAGSTSVPTDGSAVVWLEPRRTGAGYGFRSASTGGAVAHQVDLNSPPSQFVSADDTWTATAYKITLPGAGVYILNVNAVLYGEPSALGYMQTRLYDETADAEVPGSAQIGPAFPAGGAYGVVSLRAADYIADGANVIRLEAMRVSGVTWTAALVMSSGNATPTHATRVSMGYLKLG